MIRTATSRIRMTKTDRIQGLSKMTLMLKLLGYNMVALIIGIGRIIMNGKSHHNDVL